MAQLQTTETPAKRRGKSQNALTLLRRDHQDVSKMFEQYERRSSKMSSAEKKALAGKICRELTVHATVEEEIFYPAIREGFPKQEDMLNEAEVEHASAKDLIAQIEAGTPEDDLFDAKVCVLGEFVKHHVREEHSMFSAIRTSRKVDFETLGARLEERKMELKAEMAD